MINKRSQHASGVILYNKTPFETTAFMRSPSGDLTTQFSLHDAEKLGDTKFDFLVTEISDKIIICLNLLQKYGKIEQNLSLKELYNKYLHPEVLNLKDDRIWNSLANNEVLDTFQFSTTVGAYAAKVVKPTNIFEMTAANALMRLMADKGQESALEKYVRYKNNTKLWDSEMESYKLTNSEIKAVQKYYQNDYGVPPYQESVMRVLMDEEVCGFTLGESNAARKVIAKKDLSKIPALKEQIFSRAKTQNIGNYVWKTCVEPQLGYSFSILHSLAYSFVGIQTLYLATNFPSIYWNTSCLVVNAGINNDEDEAEIEEDEDEVEEVNPILEEDVINSNKSKKRVKSTDYAKLATAMSMIINNGINISKPDINYSKYSFEPDEVNNQILFGLSCIANVGKELVKDIENHRPYSSIEDLTNKIKINKKAILNLLKGGGFDSIYPSLSRKEIMELFIHSISDEKKKLNLQNFNGLIEHNLIPSELSLVVRVYQYTKVLKKYFKQNDDFVLNNEQILSFFEENFNTKLLTPCDDFYTINQKIYDKQIYQVYMDKARVWLKKNHDDVLDRFNKMLFMEEWIKYADGNISSWEMDSISFYYHEHELINVDKEKYGLSDFGNLPEEPEVDYFFTKLGKDIPIFKLYRIVGTVISKDKTRGTINLLTTSGVATVKFRKEVFAIYDKQLSEKQEDGKKKILEKSWFKKGNKIMVMGYRRDDQFVPKKYAKSIGETLYLIDKIDEKGNLSLRHER